MQCDMGTRLAYPYRDANAFDRAPLNPWALMANKSTVSHLKAPQVLVLYLERPRATVGVCNLSGQAILILRLEGSRPQGSLLAFLAHRVQAIALPWAWVGEGKLERNSSPQSGDGACRPLRFTKRRPGLQRKWRREAASCRACFSRKLLAINSPPSRVCDDSHSRSRRTRGH
jgi:hypothetical protein